MQCKCGGETKLRFSVQALPNNKIHYSEWDCCLGCTRVGGQVRESIISNPKHVNKRIVKRIKKKEKKIVHHLP